MSSPGRLACLLAGLIGLADAGEPAQVFRTFMPEAGPSAFAVLLGPQLALCYDPLRGGVNQVWQGGVDLEPTRRAKINAPARLLGPVFYAESVLQPLRLDPARMPEHRFRGYHYEAGTVRFIFTLDGVEVRETLLAVEGGRVLERRWQTAGDKPLYFLTEPQTAAQLRFIDGRETAPGVWQSQAGRLSVHLQPRSAP